MISRCAIFAFLASIFLSSSIGMAQSPKRLTVDMLPPYVLVHADIQLEGERNVSRYDDVEYSRNVTECVGPVATYVDDWMTSGRMVSSLRRVKPPEYRVEIDLDSPKPGTLVIHYIWVSSKRSAQLDIQYLSSEQMSAAERESFIEKLKLVALRRQLTSVMKCG